MQNNRCHLFLPMDALKGYKEALREKEIVKEPRKTLLEDEEIILSNKILSLKEDIFIKNISKPKTIIKSKVKITKINYTYKYLYISDKKINFSDIIEIIIC